MKRPLVVAAIGLAAAIGAIALNYMARQPEQDVAVAPAQFPAAQEAPPAASPQQDTPTTRDENPQRPTFDIVRVNPRGDIVMAGRGEPGSKIAILDGKNQIGEVIADNRGEWVFVPGQPLDPGTRRLGLEMRKPTEADDEAGKPETPVVSDSVVVLMVSKPGLDIAGRPVDAGSQALALKVPRSGKGPSEVLQKPTQDGGKGSGGADQGPSQLARRADDRSSPSSPETMTADSLEAELTAAGEENDNASLSGLFVDAVDYDQAGRVIISGRTAPGFSVHLYLNNAFLGRAVASADGRWQISLERTIDIGIYMLRVDQVDDSGNVLARREMPFARTEPLMASDDDGVVVVQPGANLWRIAHRTYGSGFDYTVIYEANREQIKNPDLIYPGQMFALPEKPVASAETAP